MSIYIIIMVTLVCVHTSTRHYFDTLSHWHRVPRQVQQNIIQHLLKSKLCLCHQHFHRSDITNAHRVDSHIIAIGVSRCERRTILPCRLQAATNIHLRNAVNQRFWSRSGCWSRSRSRRRSPIDRKVVAGVVLTAIAIRWACIDADN